MTKVVLIVSVFLLILGLSGCTQIEIDREYINIEYGFALDPPEGWSTAENVTEEVVACYSPPLRNDICLNISKPLRLDIGLALSVFADDIEEQYPEIVNNFTVVYRDWRNIEGLTAYEIVYTYNEDDISMKAKQVAVSKSRTVFLISYIATNESYDEFISPVNQSIDSFKIV
jgi:hypothetical protein